MADKELITLNEATPQLEALQTGDSAVLKLGDNAGVNKLSIQDSDGTEVAKIDSNGSGSISGDLVMAEAADHSSTPGAGFGYLWTKSTVPATLIFTDDAGTDFDLTAGGGGWSDMTEAVWVGGTQSGVSNAADSIAFEFNTDNTFTINSTKVASFQNAGTEVVSINQGRENYNTVNVIDEDGFAGLTVGNAAKTTVAYLGQSGGGNAYIGAVSSTAASRVIVGPYADRATDHRPNAVSTRTSSITVLGDTPAEKRGITLNQDGLSYPEQNGDRVPQDLTLEAQTARPSAVTNQDGGNLNIKLAEHATGGGAAGLFQVLAPDDTVVLSVSEANVIMPILPTSDPAVSGALWNEAGTLKVSA